MEHTLQKRLQKLNNGKSSHSGACIIYHMSRDVRVQDNHALKFAQIDALTRQIPLLVHINIYDRCGYRAYQHFEFMIKGAVEVAENLTQLGINCVITVGSSEENLHRLIDEYHPAGVYFDFSPLKGPLRLQNIIADYFQDIPCFRVDTHNIVPAWEVSDKEEIGARTLRPKLHRLLDEFLYEPEAIEPHPYQFNDRYGPTSVDELLKSVKAPILEDYDHGYIAGERAALAALDAFLGDGISSYSQDRNDPSQEGTSGLSPYLHFGQLSAQRVALAVMRLADIDPVRVPTKSKDAFLEELIVRKELSDNFCLYNDTYDRVGGARPWAQHTLNQHRGDRRDYIYTRDELEGALTHDRAWNAAQVQLRRVGKMHGYMRMYWAKKILEWSEDADTAFAHAVYLNDRYSLDGGDPNGYVGIAWSICGVHDRGWSERNIFGKIRYMNYQGLKRKFDIASYEARWLES